MKRVWVIQSDRLSNWLLQTVKQCCFVGLLWIVLPVLSAVAVPTQLPPLNRVDSAVVHLAYRAAESASSVQLDREQLDREQLSASSQENEHIRSAMPPDIDRILKRGKLVVALLDQDNSPFFMTNTDGELAGLDVQLAKDLADQLGVNLVFNRSAKTFDQVVQTVYRLEADLAISKLSRTLNRTKTVRFTRPYVTMRQGLLVNRLHIAQQANGRTMAEVIRDLHGKVGVLRGSSYVGFTHKKFPHAEVVEFPTWAAVVDAVIRGEVLATYRDELEVKKIILSKPDAALQFQTIALTDTQDAIAIAMPWDSQHLLALVDQYLETMQVHHTADSLLKLYADRLKE
jgi:polar amino acid transport system substrate-binding protein